MVNITEDPNYKFFTAMFEGVRTSELHKKISPYDFVEYVNHVLFHLGLSPEEAIQYMQNLGTSAYEGLPPERKERLNSIMKQDCGETAEDILKRTKKKYGN